MLEQQDKELRKYSKDRNRRSSRDSRDSRDSRYSRDYRDSRNSRDSRRSYRSDSDSSSEDDRYRSRSRHESKGNPKLSCPPITFPLNKNPKLSCPPITFPLNKNFLMKQSDSREKLFDSSLKTVNVSVNTELSMSCSSNSKKEVNDYFHVYGDGDDDVFHKVISVDNFAYSTSYNDEDNDNGERHAGLKPCETGLETCDVLKPIRHGNELLDNSIQSAGTKESSGIDNIAYFSGDDTGGTGHTQVYESRENMLDSHSISDNQRESDMDLVEDISSDDEIYSDRDDGDYFSTEESLEEILNLGSFQSSLCTVVSFQDKPSLTDLDPGTALRSLEVPNPCDKWEDVDLASFSVFDEMPLEVYDQNAVHSNHVGFVSSSIDIVDYVEDILRSVPHLNYYFLQNHLIVMTQLLFVLS